MVAPPKCIRPKIFIGNVQGILCKSMYSTKQSSVKAITLAGTCERHTRDLRPKLTQLLTWAIYRDNSLLLTECNEPTDKL